MKCNTLVKQESTSDPHVDAQSAFDQALREARKDGEIACQGLDCENKDLTCLYFETKVEGTTTYDPATEKWTSVQVSSGECRCGKKVKVGEEEVIFDCATEVKQTVVYFNRIRDIAVRDAEKWARQLASDTCKGKHCQQKQCTYEQSDLSGKTQNDYKLNPPQYRSEQTSQGKCACS